jgi:gamma-glutamyltranspeptidase/glutathione hydrolase
MPGMTIDKDRTMSDPAFVAVPTEQLLSGEYTADVAAGIRRGDRLRVTRLERKAESDTTHVSVVDRDGNCVTMTHTLASPSGAITDGLGFMYNGSTSRCDPRPGHAGSIAPGKRRASSAAPTIVFKGDAPRIVIGAPGGSYIAPPSRRVSATSSTSTCRCPTPWRRRASWRCRTPSTCRTAFART